MPFAIVEAKGLGAFNNNPDIQVLGYQVRTSIYDKTSVISNVHTMKARIHKENWKFSSKV